MITTSAGRSFLPVLILVSHLSQVVCVDPNFVPWDFVPPLKFNALCMQVCSEIGEKSADPKVSKSTCEKVIGPLASKAGADISAHCQYISEQLEIVTLQERYKGGPEFCKNLLMFQSYSLKTDLLLYVTPQQLDEVCKGSVTTAMERNPTMDKADAIRTGLPIACKGEMEGLFRANNMPIPSATVACKAMVKKADVALEAGELDPNDNGKQFCDGQSMQGKAFEAANKSPAPMGFPLTESDWKPKITLADLEKMIRKAFSTPKVAFTKYDKNKDGGMDAEEWAAMCGELGIPTWDAKVMFKEGDKNKDGKVDSPEWQEVIPVTVPDLVKYSNEKHKNAKKAWQKADASGEGTLDPTEFEAFCKGIGVSPESAKALLPEIDKDGSGDISKEEFMNVFGVDMPEMRRRARAKFGSPEESFAKIDPNGDGSVSPEEFEKACADLNIPPANAKKLLKEADTDGSGEISPEEWEAAAKMSEKELQQAMAKNLGAGGAAAADAMDADGDGKVSADELKKGLKKAGATDEEAEQFAKEMDKDGDGKVDADELHKGTGGDALDEARGYKHPSAAGDSAAGAGGITVPEFKDRATKKYKTPQEAFDAFDVNPKDGKISPEELAAGGATLEPPVTPEEAKTLFKPIDENGDGGIDPEEFFKILGGCATCKEAFIPLTVPEFKERAKAKHGTPQAAFDAFDTSPTDGKISPNELQAGGALLQPPVTPDQAKGLFGPIDKNGDGGISPEEFFEALGGCADCGKTFSPTAPGLAGPGGPAEGGAADAAAEEPAAGQIGDLDGDGKISPEEKMAKTKALDKDGDGVISPAEMGEAAASGKLSPEEMKKMDTDGDGKLSGDEIKQAAKASSADPADRQKALDADGDGKLSGDELAKAAAEGKLPPAEMKKLDKDGDGKLSPDELEQGAKEANTKAAAAAPKEKMKSAMKKKFKSPEEAMKTMDADGDGKISPEEMEQGLKDQGVSPDEAKKMAKDLDKDGDGKVSPDEMYAATGPPGEFTKSPGEPGYVEPKTAPETPVSLPELKNRMGQAYKNTGDAWDKIAGPGAAYVTPEKWKEGVKNLGVPPGEADKLFKQIDADGDGKVSKEEFENAIGVEPDEVQDKFVEAFPNPEDAMKAADKDGDGKVSEAELQEVMQKKLGLTPENAKKAAQDMMKKLDPQGTGKIDGAALKDAVKPKADDMANKIEKELGSAGDAMKKWDKDGDGKMTKEEFMAGAKEMGMPPDVAEDMFKAQDKDGDGVMNADDFSRAFGLGPDKLMELCFQHYGNPVKAFDEMDADHDGLLSPAEWKKGGEKMGLKPDQIDRLLRDMDSNHKEKTPGHISKWEFFDYMDYAEPAKASGGDGYGDIDPFGQDHKKFNELPHMGETGTTAAAAQPAQTASQPAASTPTDSSSQYTVDHCSSCDVYDLLQVGEPVPATGVRLVNCCGKLFNATFATRKFVPELQDSQSAAQKLEEEVSTHQLPVSQAEEEPKRHFYNKIPERDPSESHEHFLSKKHHVKRELPHHRKHHWD